MAAYDEGLLRALVNTPEKTRAYLHSLEFHALIDSLVLTLPPLIESYATLAAAHRADLAQQVRDIMGRPVPTILDADA